MFTAARFTIAKIWKQPNCPSMNECIHTHTHTHTHNGKIFIQKKNEILPFATTWMGLEGIMLSEIRQTEKDKYHDLTYR